MPSSVVSESSRTSLLSPGDQRVRRRRFKVSYMNWKAPQCDIPLAKLSNTFFLDIAKISSLTAFRAIRMTMDGKPKTSLIRRTCHCGLQSSRLPEPYFIVWRVVESVGRCYDIVKSCSRCGNQTYHGFIALLFISPCIAAVRQAKFGDVSRLS